MLDETRWLELSNATKHIELQEYLKELVLIEKGTHELSHTREQGKLTAIKTDLQNKIFKIIELENAS
jgi:hypothetical protein